MNSQVLENVEELVSWPRRVILWFISEVRWITRVLISSADRFYWDNGFSKAAALAYTTLFSLVPITALAFGMLASFGVLNRYVPEVQKFIFNQFVPNLQSSTVVLDYLNQFRDVLASLNILVVGVLVFTSLLLINSIEYALNEVWQVFESRSIASRISIFSAVLLIAPVLAISAYYFLQFRVEPLLAEYVKEESSMRYYRELLPFFIDFSAFLLLYYLVPKAPVKFRSANFGAFIAALLFGGAKTLFVVYIEEFSSYNKVYGAIAAVPIFLFWLYLAWTILLFGAECSYQAQYLPRTGKLWKRSILSVGDAAMLLSMQALVMIAKAFADGKELPNDLEIAETLGCSSTVLKPALDRLENAGIISRGDSRDMPLTLMRDPTKIRVTDVQQALFTGRNALFFPVEMSRMFKFLNKAAPKQDATLADILHDEDNQAI